MNNLNVLNKFNELSNKLQFNEVISISSIIILYEFLVLLLLLLKIVSFKLSRNLFAFLKFCYIGLQFINKTTVLNNPIHHFHHHFQSCKFSSSFAFQCHHPCHTFPLMTSFGPCHCHLHPQHQCSVPKQKICWS